MHLSPEEIRLMSCNDMKVIQSIMVDYVPIGNHRRIGRLGGPSVADMRGPMWVVLETEKTDASP